MTAIPQPTNVTSLDLYRAAQELCLELEAREGVTDEELDAAIGAFLDGSEDKLDRHRYAIDSFTAQAKLYRTEVQRLQQRARMLEGIASRIKDHAKLVLEARCELMGEAEGRKVETANGIVYLRKGTKLIIEDEEQFLHLNREHKQWVTYKPVIDKRAVTAALKGDAEVPCARLENAPSVVFK